MSAETPPRSPTAAPPVRRRSADPDVSWPVPVGGPAVRSGCVAVLLVVSMWLGGGAAPATAAGPTGTPVLAAGSPFDDDAGDEDAADDAGTSVDPGTGSAAGTSRTDRLGRIARELRRTPFVVDPELEWMFDARTQRSVERLLRGARIPVFVAVLPAIDEDESGGDLERIVQRLQRDVGKDGLYVAVDQDARMDLASVGVPLDLGISFSVLNPPRDERPYEVQERDPAPAPAASVPGRLREIVDTVAKAGPGTPNAVIDDVRERSSLPGEAADARRREDAWAGVFLGLVLGALLSGVALVVLRVAHARRVRGPGGGGSAAGRSSRTGRGGRWPRGGAGGASGGRRGRRRRGRRA